LAFGQTELFNSFNVSTDHIFSVFGSSFVVLINLSETTTNGMPQLHLHCSEILRHYILKMSFSCCCGLQAPKNETAIQPQKYDVIYHMISLGS